MIAPGQLCSVKHPLNETVTVYPRLDIGIGMEVTSMMNGSLFTIVSVPHRNRSDNHHYAYGIILSNGRLGFVDCRYLIEVR